MTALGLLERSPASLNARVKGEQMKVYTYQFQSTDPWRLLTDATEPELRAMADGPLTPGDGSAPEDEPFREQCRILLMALAHGW
jgi:hypothetical protein